ncbi:hypothetical protein HDU97_001664 [Phlyctochytrium planicorne]|nr:hypothetical protein HDU97_001664 [Phlyctochytrium planicorne]
MDIYWNTTDAKVGTIAVEAWFHGRLRSIWFIIAKGFVTEGTLSLIVTLISGAILGLFFFGFGYLWNPVYEVGKDYEETACSGNAIYTTFVGTFVAIRDGLKLSRFMASASIPIAVWIIVSLVSSATQVSIHSIVANQIRKYSGIMTGINLSSTINSYMLIYPIQGVSLPVAEDIGFAVLAGQDMNLTDVSFLLNGMICSGQLIPHATFETTCFVDRTTCEHARYEFQAGVPTYLWDNTLFDDSSIYYFSKYDLLAFTNLLIVNSDAYLSCNTVEDDWGDEIDVCEYDITNKNVTFEYSGVLPLDKIMTWRSDGETNIAPSPEPDAIYYSPARVISEKETKDYWSGRCDMRIDLCDVVISNSNNITTTFCSPANFKTNDTSFNHETMIGVGEVWRTDNTFANVISRLADSQHELFSLDPSGGKIIEKAIGIMGFAWATTFLQLSLNGTIYDFNGNAADAVHQRESITYNQTILDPLEAIAMDAALIFTMLSLLVLSIVIWGLGFGTAIFGGDEVIWLNKMTWDPLFKYAVLVNEEEKRRRKLDVSNADKGLEHGNTLVRFPKPKEFANKRKGKSVTPA